MKKALALLVVLAAGGGGAYWYFVLNAKKPEPTVNTGTVTRGNVVDTVSTTGALSAISQVVVGAQVSGVVLDLNGVDFNSIVKKGQVLAKLDPQTVQTQILQAEANLVRSQTDVEKSKVTLEDAQKKYTRSKDLGQKGLITQADLDTAELNLHSAESGLKSSQAALQQSQASLEQQKVNLEHTIILSPIDGLVISRAVDVGQTVNASMNAPAIFTIAADLTKMKVIAGVDESDVGRIRPDQHVTFRVDAYPNEVFQGKVEQVRLEPKLQQNVVTYQTVISVPNPELKLKPGMTANLNVEISRVDDVLRVPNAALRFRPTNDMYTALGLEPPADTGRGGRGGGRNAGGPGAGGPGGGGGRPGGGAGAPAGAAPAGAPAPGAGENAAVTAPAGAATGAGRQSADARPSGGDPSRGGGGRSGGGRGGDMTPEQMARLQAMTPEERAAAGQGGRGGTRNQGGQGGQGGQGQGGQGGQGGFNGNNGGRGGNRNGQFGGQNGGGGRGGDRTANGGNGGGRGGNGGGRGGNGQNQGRGGRSNGPTEEAVIAQKSSGATTIDSLFPALPRVETRGRAWTWNKEKKELKQINLRLGISDGQATQLIEGDLAEGAEVVTNVIVASVRPGLLGGPQQGNPFFQQGPGGRGPGGPGGPGGGGNRGGGGGGRGGF